MYRYINEQFVLVEGNIMQLLSDDVVGASKK